LNFYRAIQSEDKAKAKEIVETIELKYFEKVVPLGWHPSLKIALHIAGLMQPFERRPMKQFSKEEIALMRLIFNEFKWS
jgi:hypothetical protein